MRATETDAPCSRDGSRESVEQRPLREILGVPLHGNRPRGRAIRRLRGFDDPVVGPGDSAKTGREIANRLMVAAVDGCGPRAQRALEQRARFDMDTVLAGLAAVGDRTRPPAI